MILVEATTQAMDPPSQDQEAPCRQSDRGVGQHVHQRSPDQHVQDGTQDSADDPALPFPPSLNGEAAMARRPGSSSNGRRYTICIYNTPSMPIVVPTLP
ncbi:hypothetical protein VTN77DRAFT_3971 [Rasamsonia byssochlamydoides]|uniref:uncharacterized protein n=1 Tax=Rasamsonia byssochlamydoides TaxID=89139 RepID=UPI0037422D91